MIARPIVAAVVAMLLTVQVIRTAFVNAAAARAPEQAARLWPGHPSVEISRAMAQIAQAAREKRQVPASAFSLMASAAVKDPLAPQPFLVRGVQAELAGDGATAERAFHAAQWRDPRSLPAAYFLADRYLRKGDVAHGLPQVAALARLSPGGSSTVAPYLAAYARSPANWPALRSLFQQHPDLSGPALTVLATNPSSAAAVLALADPKQKPLNSPWLGPLLNSLVTAGDYANAHAIWARAAGVRAGSYLYDASFADKASPPPFNWSLTSSAVGLAERQPGGRLHVVFYGQQDGILATQLLLLPPGTYRLSMQLTGDVAHARSLNWSVWCDKAAEALGSVTLDAAAQKGWQFSVPGGCRAQWVKLSGVSGDLPQQVDATVSALKLERVGDGA
jgi:hypothetical protein